MIMSKRSPHGSSPINLLQRYDVQHAVLQKIEYMDAPDEVESSTVPRAKFPISFLLAGIVVICLGLYNCVPIFVAELMGIKVWES